MLTGMLIISGIEVAFHGVSYACGAKAAFPHLAGWSVWFLVCAIMKLLGN